MTHEHVRFEWDDAKARKNLAKHGVDFEDAAAALSDTYAERFHVEWYDDAHSIGEDRMITLASDPEDRRIVYYIVWTARVDELGPLTRIISARNLSRAERRQYEREVYG